MGLPEGTGGSGQKAEGCLHFTASPHLSCPQGPSVPPEGSPPFVSGEGQGQAQGCGRGLGSLAVRGVGTGPNAAAPLLDAEGLPRGVGDATQPALPPRRPAVLRGC